MVHTRHPARGTSFDREIGDQSRREQGILAQKPMNDLLQYRIVQALDSMPLIRRHVRNRSASREIRWVDPSSCFFTRKPRPLLQLDGPSLEAPRLRFTGEMRRISSSFMAGQYFTAGRHMFVPLWLVS